MINQSSLNNYEEELNKIIKQIESGKDIHIAYNNLGILYGLINDYEKSDYYFKCSIKANINYSEPYINLGIIFNSKNEFDVSIEYFNKALSLTPNNAGLLYNYAYALQENGEIYKAITFYEKALIINPNLADAHFNKGLLNLLTGNYSEGWKEYVNWGYISGNLKQRDMKGILWTGESYVDKTLYIYSDQGFGDAINFFRYLPEIKKLGGRLIFECPKQLYSLFENSNKCCFDILTTPENNNLNYDYYYPLSNILKFFDYKKINYQTSPPYLKVNKQIKQKWNDLIGFQSEIKIGFLWKGNPYPPINKKRHANLLDFYPLFNLPNIRWYSLFIEKDNDLKISGYKNIFDLTDKINNFEDTAALIENMDLIITIDSGVMHLAGALNKKVFLLLSYVADWRWGLNDTKSELYPNTIIFRQNSDKKWDSVIQTIKYQLMNNYKDKI